MQDPRGIHQHAECSFSSTDISMCADCAGSVCCRSIINLRLFLIHWWPFIHMEH